MAQAVQQHQLEILRQYINDTGRTQLQTNLRDGDCSTGGQSSSTNQFEIKRGATITAAEAAKIIKATCLESHATDTLRQAFAIPQNASGTGGSATDSTSIWMVAQVAKVSGDKLTLLMPTSIQDGAPSQQTVSLASSAKVFKDGAKTTLKALRKGDLVLTINRMKYASASGGYPTSNSVVGLVILPSDPELKWYGSAYRAQLTPITMCEGNSVDECSFTGSIDFFPSGGGEDNAANPALPTGSGVMKEISGTITEIAPTHTKISTSSGRIFQINFGSNPAADFNRDRMQNYGNDPVEVGDKLLVRYREPADRHGTTIARDHIFNAVLAVEFAGKDKPIKQY
jgi:hypothetical protein